MEKKFKIGLTVSPALAQVSPLYSIRAQLDLELENTFDRGLSPFRVILPPFRGRD
jgi:hypothetical protein